MRCAFDGGRGNIPVVPGLNSMQPMWNWNR